MSRWGTWSKGSEHKEKRGFASFMKEDPQRMGNPAVNAGGPAERAAAFGLQSDGSGNYIDPKTGQKVATTVNNELVFMDNNRATGGAISDSSGGAALTQAAPSWVDPMTGMVTVPPAQPESPEEISAIPDATPATAPKGYDAFMNKKKDQAYAMGAGGPEAFSQGTPEIGLDSQPGGINPIGGMGGPDLAPTMGENYKPEDLSKRDINRPVTTKERVRVARTALTDPEKVKARQALRAKSNTTPGDALNAIKMPKDITKDNSTTRKYLDKVKDTINRTYADSEKDMDDDEAQSQRAGSSQAQRDIIQGKGAFGASNDEIDDFKSYMKKIRDKRNQQELDASSPQPKPEVNVSNNEIGRGSETSKIESAQLFALKRVIQDGILPGDFDLEKDIEEIYGQNADKVRSSISGARELAKHLGLSPGEIDDEYEYGKFDGQSTTISDDDRSNLYDNIFSDILTGLGRKNLPPQRKTARTARDWTDEELKQEGSKILGNLTGTDPGAGIKDNWQTADVYMNRKGTREKIQNDISAIMDNFGDQPNVAMMLVQGYLSRQHNARNLMGISLKELSSGAENMKVSEYNTGFDDWVDVLNADLEGNLNLNYNLGDSRKIGMGDFDFGSNSMTFDGTLEGKKGEEDFQLPFQWESRPSGKSDTLKVEPNDKFVVDRGRESNIGELRRKTGHLGMLSQRKMNDIMKEITGEDLDHMLPNKIGEGFTDEMKNYWKSTLKELMASNSPFGNFGDGLKFRDKDVEPDDWIDNLTGSVDNNSLSNSDFEELYGVPRSQKTHTAVRNKLRHMRIMKALVDQHKEGKGHSLLGKFLLGAGKINQSPNEYYAPRIQIS